MKDRLGELLWKWRERQITAGEMAELNRLLDTPAGRAVLRADFEMEVALRQVVAARRAVARSQERAEAFAAASQFRASWWLPWISPGRRTPQRVWAATAGLAAVAILAAILLSSRSSRPKPEPARLAAGMNGFVQRGSIALPFSGELVLQAGDRVVTASNGWAVVSDQALGVHLELESGSQLWLPERRGGALWKLPQGGMQAAVAPRRQPSLVFETPELRLDIVGTKFALWAGPDGARLDVEQGLVRVRSRVDGQVAEVPSDFHAELGADRVLRVQPGANVNRLADRVEGMIVWDDNDPAVRFSSGWMLRRHGRFNNSTHETCKPGEWVEFTFNGVGFVLTGEKMPYGGTAELFLDGQSRGSINYYAPYPGFTRRIVCSFDRLPPGAHTVRLVSRGDGWVYVDSVRIQP